MGYEDVGSSELALNYMYEFLLELLNILKELKIKPVLYGSYGVSQYLGDFKEFEEVDLLVPDEFMNNRWNEFKTFIQSKGFSLIDEKEHEFGKDGKRVGFASVYVLVRDKIIENVSKLIQYKKCDALTLSPEDFLKAYQFSVKDGYRIEKRGKNQSY